MFWQNVTYAKMILAKMEPLADPCLIGIMSVFVLQDFMARIAMTSLMLVMEILALTMLNVKWSKLEDSRNLNSTCPFLLENIV